MGLAEAVLLYAAIGVYALVVGALVAGSAWAVVSSIEVIDDLKRNGW